MLPDDPAAIPPGPGATRPIASRAMTNDPRPSSPGGDPVRVGFFGPFGTNTEQAVRSQPDLADQELVAFPSVPDVLDAVASR